MEAEKNELRDRIDLDGNRLEVLENGNLRKHNELEFKSQRLVKADSDVQAFLRKNDALKVCCDTSSVLLYVFLC